LDALQSQVDAALGRLTIASQRIQRITRENDALRRDIADLRRQIARRELLQPA
jgi:peptidoglycan hydrolase CwlO-like protein